MLKANASEQNRHSPSRSAAKLPVRGLCFSWVVAQRRQEMQAERVESRRRGHLWRLEKDGVLKGPPSSRGKKNQKGVHLETSGAFRDRPLPAVGRGPARGVGATMKLQSPDVTGGPPTAALR